MYKEFYCVNNNKRFVFMNIIKPEIYTFLFLLITQKT